jgi:hypothetical protein
MSLSKYEWSGIFTMIISDYTVETMERLEPDTGQYSEKNCSEYAFRQRIYSI